MASLYTPGMTIDQFRAKLQADPGFQQLVSSAARLPNGQFTPQAGLAISRYAQASGLNDLNLAQIHTGDPHRSTYSIDGNGGILEQHDGKGPEFWGPIIVGAVSGGAIAAPYLASTGGLTVAGVEGGQAGISTGTVGALGTGAMAPTAVGGTLGTTAAGTTAALGPSTGANIAATSGVVGGNSVPPALAATGGSSVASAIPWGQVISTGIGSTANLYGGKSAANAQKEAAALQAKAISDAAALQKQSADATLAFEKDQADKTRADNITAQNANFGQWGYRQNVIRPYQGTGLQAENTLAQMLGLPAVNTTLPDLPAAPVFSSNASPSGSAATPSAPPSASAGGNDPVTQQLLSNYKTLGVTPTGRGTGPTDIAYYADEINKTGGATPQNLAYWMGPNGRIATDLAKAKGGLSSPPQTIGSYAGMPPVAPTPAGTGTTLPFIPLNLGGYAGVQA